MILIDTFKILSLFGVAFLKAGTCAIIINVRDAAYAQLDTETPLLI